MVTCAGSWTKEKKNLEQKTKKQQTRNSRKTEETAGWEQRERGTRYKVNTFGGLRVGKWSVISHPRQVFPYGGPTDRGGRAKSGSSPTKFSLCSWNANTVPY